MRSSLLKSKDTLPIVPHGDNGPAFGLRFRRDRCRCIPAASGASLASFFAGCSIFAEMVFAELRSHVALRLEQLGDGHIPGLQALFRTRQANLEQPGAESALAGDERGPSGGAALLAVPIREERALFRDAVNVGRLVAHHTLVVGADIPIADVVAP